MTEQAAGAFVSLHAHGQLRGCIGTTGPTTESVAWEIPRTNYNGENTDRRSCMPHHLKPLQVVLFPGADAAFLAGNVDLLPF